MNTRTDSPEVLYAADEIVLLGEHDLDELKRLALHNPRKCIRICTHRSPEDSLHEMFILHPRGYHVRPHKHIGKAESFSVLEGEVDVILFNEEGVIIQTIEMGAPSTGKSFYYRLADPIYHTLIIKSDIVIFHEVTQGPFNREQTVYSNWIHTQQA